MHLFKYLPLLVAGWASLVAASPRTATPGPAYQPTPTTRTIYDLNNRAEPSIPPVSIPPVSIPSVSLDLPTITPPSISAPSCIPSVPPGKDGYRPPGSCDAYYNYFPSFGAAVAFSVFFGVVLVAHIGQAFHHRTGYGWVIIMASLWEFASYATRALGSKNQESLGYAMATQLLVLLAPLWVNAFAYMVFARIVHFYAPTKKAWFISPSSLAFIFVALDIVSFIVQGIGGTMAGPDSSPETMMNGVHIYMGGIGLQEFFILIFMGLMVKFHRDQIFAERMNMVATHKSGSWKPLLYALYGCLVAITVRIIFRLIEFSGGVGDSNPLPHKEGYFYGLDSIPMLIAVGVWNVFHPGRFMQGPDAKLPRSWLSRHLCCCCHRKRKEDTGEHQRLQDESEAELQRLPSYHTYNAH